MGFHLQGHHAWCCSEHVCRGLSPQKWMEKKRLAVAKRQVGICDTEFLEQELGAASPMGLDPAHGGHTVV